MKILLLGEFSGLHKNLKEGLCAIGHRPDFIGYRDGKKRIDVDISLEPRFTGTLGKIEKRARLLSLMPKLKDYDVVQIINPLHFYMGYFPSSWFYRNIFTRNKSVYILGAGSDSYFWQEGRARLRYGPFEDTLEYDMQAFTARFESKRFRVFNERIVRRCTGIIPVMYEYEASYRDLRHRLETIPIPINIDKIHYHPNIPRGRIVILHGLTRYGFKGTRHVEKAFDILRAKYPNDLELIIAGNMPLKDYLNIMRRANLVIDQLNSYSLGVNGIYALAMGKVVIGGAEPESLESLGVSSSPAINVRPSSADLVRVVESIIAQKKRIPEMGWESRRFAEQIHSHKVIARRYLKVWTGQLSTPVKRDGLINTMADSV